ncbi:MAG TPA: hypothetical protein VNT29_11630 [Candidatus Limnocylindrales bacterium]|nr:hypothetical protein [Candidatus Limnocylindrales bacterium]
MFLPFGKAKSELASVLAAFAAFGQIDEVLTANYGNPIASLTVAS